MAIKRDKVKTRATLADKIAGKKRRTREFTRDLRGRFSFAKETSRSPGDLSRTGKQVTRKVRPQALLRASGFPKKRTRLRK